MCESGLIQLIRIINLFFVSLVFALIISCENKKSAVQMEDSTEIKPIYLYKIISVDDWEKSYEVVHLSSMDADFIHLSTEEQLDKIIKKYWADASEYVVLKIETSKLPGDLVFETNPGGTHKYYHLYNGIIPLSAIIEMKVHKRQPR